MIADIDVINAALVKIQAQPISSPEDDNERALAARECWEMTLGSFLAEFDWHFAMRTAGPAALAESGADPRPYRRAYALPADLVKVIAAAAADRPEAEGPKYEVRLGGGGPRQSRLVLCCDADPIVTYISRDVTFDLFTPPALEALTFRLAMALDMHLNAGANTRNLGEFYAMARENAVNAEARTANREKLAGTYTKARLA